MSQVDTNKDDAKPSPRVKQAPPKAPARLTITSLTLKLKEILRDHGDLPVTLMGGDVKHLHVYRTPQGVALSVNLSDHVPQTSKEAQP